MGKYYDEFIKKRKKEEEEERERWNRENPDKKIGENGLPEPKTTVSGKSITTTGVKDDKSFFEEFLSGYLTKGAMKDGYQFGDVTKTILGTGFDILDDAEQSIIGMGESLIDTGAGAIRRLLPEEKQQGITDFIKRDLVGEYGDDIDIMSKLPGAMDLDKINQRYGVTQDDIRQGWEKDSVLGDKADSLVQSAVQMGATAGLQGVGVPWFLTTGVTSFGSGIEEALNDGAEIEEAEKYGLVRAAADTLTEKISGGISFGSKTLFGDAIDLKGTITKNITNKVLKTATKYGLDMAGEGAEEILAEAVGNAGKALYKDDSMMDLVFNEGAFEQYLDAFVGGALISGGANARRAYKSVKEGRDYDSGLSDNEQHMVDDIVNKKTSERQKEIAIDEEVNKRINNTAKGDLTDTEKRNIRKAVMDELESGKLELDYEQTKVDKKEAAAIREEVQEDLKKGYVDMDDIENMFAGKEFEELQKLKAKPTENMTEAEKSEHEAKMDEIKGSIEAKMGAILKDSPYFTESYRQKLLKGESFVREETETDTEITKELAESAKAAGMNNTGRMHDLFEYTNKIANDTDTKYGFINSKQLQDMGYSMENATINGMVRLQKDGTTKVLINVDSNKALNTIIGHETTHLFEGTKEHEELAEAVKAYAQMKGEYDARLKATEELYKGVENANIENEVTADLVGEYIFTDEQFIQELTKKPNVFQKVYDYVKHAYKMATAGSAEAKQLLKAKKAFEKAYREAGITKSIENDLYSVGEKRGRGYDGKSMSVNARLAYDADERPMSKWTKSELLETVKTYAENNDIDVDAEKIGQLTAEELRTELLEQRGWHHTGALYNKTDFYGIREGGIEALTGDRIDSIISERTKKERRKLSEEEKAERQKVKDNKTKADEIYDKLDFIFQSGSTGLKSLNGLGKRWMSGKLNLDEAYNEAIEHVRKRDLDKVKNWEALPEGHWRRNDAELYRQDIEAYARKQYQQTGRRNKGLLDDILRRTENKKKTAVFSLSGQGEYNQVLPAGSYEVYGRDVKTRSAFDDIAPVAEPTVAKTETVDNIAPVKPPTSNIEGVHDAEAYHDYVESIAPDYREGKAIKKPTKEFPDYEDTTVPMDKESMRLLTKNMKEVLGLNQTQRSILKDVIQDYSTGKIATPNDLYNAIADQFSVQSYEVINEELKAVKKALRETPIHVSDSVKDGISNYFKFRQQNFGKLKLGNSGLEIDDAYEALREVYPGHFPEDITNIEDQLYHMEEIANMEASSKEEYVLPEERIAEATDFIRESVMEYKRVKKLNESLKWRNPDGTLTRAAVHAGYMQNIKDAFGKKGMDFDSVLANGKNLSTFATVDNTPQRVMEKTFGYKEGQLLSDLTVNKAAENETAAIRWLNSFTNKKNGTLAKLSKKYNIKPFSKEDAAAQKYAEGMHVNQYGDYVEYGDRELEVDIKDPQMRAKIKAFVADPQLRQIYDETLDAINASRKRNGYREIPKRKDYFLHFREMDDTFSKIGIPFNPNDIKAKDLPTDINGMTADLKPGQPWFGSSMQRKGVGTTYSLLGGMEKYLTAAKPQIFHIDDIQILRALRNSVADTYGQAKGLESLDEMTDEEAEARIEKVYGSHLSTFAKFLNEEANIMAGKTALIDRGLEGVLGRRAISFMNALNTNVARNMIGYNLSSSLTNFVSVTQAAAKASKYDVIKAFTQTTSNKIKSTFGKGDDFAEQNSAIVRRKGQEKFYRKPWEKISDSGFVFMSAIDDISTEFIVRTKYNELTRKGMSEEQAHDEAGKWAMRILGDRSFGQMPQIFNSKTLGLVTKFQLEVRNQLDSMVYDTVQEAYLSTEDIQDKSKRNAVKAAKITSTMVQLAVFQHLFGKAFESVAGYNPTFDIIENLMTLFGFDDDEESEDTFTDNLEEALLGLSEDLPYFGALTGGRIPIEAALPIEQLVQGKDDYGNDKSRVETLKEMLPYYFMPTGTNQIKKSVQVLKMFDEDLPLPGSYTDSGNLRFPVEDTTKNRIQAGLFGQWANENAREYFDGEHTTLKKNQIQELKELDIPIADYWEIRDGMSGLKKNKEKIDYIANLELPVDKKNVLAKNVMKKDVDLEGYNGWEEFDFSINHPEEYSVAQFVGGYDEYISHKSVIDGMESDKREDGSTINGSKKQKIMDYLAESGLSLGEQAIFMKLENSQYVLDDSMHYALFEHINQQITGEEDVVGILEKLGYTIDEDGNVGW